MPEASTPPRRVLYMYGAVSQGELKNFLELQSVDTDERKHEMMRNWKKGALYFQELVQKEEGIAESIEITDPDPKWSDFLTSLSQDSLFKGTFGNFPVEIKLVEADKIVASQRTVNVDYVDRLVEGYKHSEENLMHFCLDPVRTQPTPKVMRSQQNAFTFSSDNPDFRFLGAFEEKVSKIMPDMANIGGQPVWSVVLLVGYGSSTINVYSVGHRVILNNGFHRVYALRKLGITRIPVAVQLITSPDLEFPPVVANLPKDYLLKAKRPALIKDFFDTRLVCEVQTPAAMKSVRTAWGADQSEVPI